MQPWTLKLPVKGVDISRDEITYDAGPGEPPPEATELLTAFVRGRQVRPVTQIKTKRLRWSLVGPEGQDLGELVDDRVSVLKGASITQRFREIEVESGGLDDERLKKIAVGMRRAGASTPDQMPKAIRALGERALAPPDWFVLPPSPDEPVSAAVKASIGAAAKRIITHDPAARIGDPEGVHQMRVAVRRLRSDMRMFATVLDPVWSQELGAELRWLGDVLGPARDADVLIERLRADAADLGDAIAPFFSELERWRAAAAVTLRAGIGDSRYVALLDRLLQDLAGPGVLPEASAPCRSVMPPLVAETWRLFANKARRVNGESLDEELHAVRILAKRTRYAAEAAAQSLGPQSAREATRFARGAEEIQNILGEHQDAAIARRKLMDMAAVELENGPLSFALGRLVERQSMAGERGRRLFESAWRRLDQKGKRTWLNRRGSR